MAEEIKLPFHRKHRPKNLKGYIGNKKLKNSVMQALKSDIKPQVILLQGPAGTGKTSMARLITTEYLCENRDVEKGACGVCDSCKNMREYIETGKSDLLLNVREVDATDNNKKQDIEDLLDDASTPSFDGNWKIYILDECHAITPSAQNRLLKTLEEPPEKVLIILCTTNPEKMIGTIVSRCQYVLQVQKPSRDELIDLMIQVCKEEGIGWERKALGLICTKGDFVPRDTLIALESISREVKDVTYANTVQVLDMIADKYFFEFFEMLTAEVINTQRYVKFLSNLKEKMDLKSFVNNLITFTKRGIYISSGVMVEALDVSELKQYTALFAKFKVEEMAYLLNTLLRIKESQDIETRLMVLGFEGLHPQVMVQAPNNKAELLDNAQYSAKEEKATGEKSFIESTTITEEEMQEKIADFSKPMTPEEIAAKFGAIKIV